MILLSHPTGNNFVRETAMALAAEGKLAELHLSIATCGNDVFSHLSKWSAFREIDRRRYDRSLSRLLRLHPWREGGRLLAARLNWRFLIHHEIGIFSLDAVYRSFDRVVSRRLAKRKDLGGVYCYEDGAFESFRAAKSAGIFCFYDLPIAYWRTCRQLLDEEAERLPDWKPTLVGIFDSETKCARKDEELALADVIICPSRFVKDSLPRVIGNSKPVHVIPFGSPLIPEHLPTVGRGRAIDGADRRNQKLKVLFAGSMTQRKGLADVFAALKLLDPSRFELHVMGSPVTSMAFYLKQYPDFIHHHTRPHRQVLALMQTMDVLVLPSIVEGRALVQQEALACGLPILVTKNAGAQDLVEDGQAGFLVPIRCPQEIAGKLEILESDRERLAEMKRAALGKAREVTWESYRIRIVEAVKTAQEVLQRQ